MVRQNMNHERSPIPVLTGPSVENYMYGDRDQRATIIRVTIRPVFPGHVLFFGPCPGVRADFPKIGRMSGFYTLEPADDNMFQKLI